MHINLYPRVQRQAQKGRKHSKKSGDNFSEVPAIRALNFDQENSNFYVKHRKSCKIRWRGFTIRAVQHKKSRQIAGFQVLVYWFTVFFSLF